MKNEEKRLYRGLAREENQITSPTQELNIKIILHESDSTDAEKACRQYYESLGFNVFKTTNKKMFEKMISTLETPKNRLKRTDILLPGIPDFFVYKQFKKEKKIYVNDYFFVEAKSSNDFLHYSQIIWILRHPNEKVIVFWLRNYNPLSTKHALDRRIE